MSVPPSLCSQTSTHLIHPFCPDSRWFYALFAKWFVFGYLCENQAQVSKISRTYFLKESHCPSARREKILMVVSRDSSLEILKSELVLIFSPNRHPIIIFNECCDPERACLLPPAGWNPSKTTPLHFVFCSLCSFWRFFSTSNCMCMVM